MTQAYNLSQLANRANTSGQLDASTALYNQLPIANGGTGQSTANAALNALLPSQTSNSGKYLYTNGTNASWVQPTTFSGAQSQTSAADITLTAASVQVQQIAMTTSYKRVILPVATTYSTLSANIFVISNVGTYPFDIAVSNGARVKRVLPGESYNIGLSQNATATGGWIANGTQTLFYGSYVNTNIPTNILENIPFLYKDMGTKISSAYSVTALSATAFFIAFIDANTNDAYGVVGTISSGTISFGTPTLIVATTAETIFAVAVDSTNVIVGITNNADDYFLRGCIVSGTTFTLTTTNPATSTSLRISQMKKLDSTRVVLCAQSSTSTGNSVVRVAEISGTTITAGTSASMATPTGTWVPQIDFAVLTSTSIGIFYSTSTSATTTTGSLRVGTISGTTITLGTAIIPAQYGVNLNPIGGGAQAYAISSTEFGWVTERYSGTATVSGTAVTQGNITDAIITPQSTDTCNASTTLPLINPLKFGYFGAVQTGSNNNLINYFGDGTLINSWDADAKQGGARIYKYISGVGLMPAVAIDTLTMPRYAVFASLSSTTCVAVGLAPNNNGTDGTNFFLGATVLTTL